LLVSRSLRRIKWAAVLFAGEQPMLPEWRQYPGVSPSPAQPLQWKNVPQQSGIILPTHESMGIHQPLVEWDIALNPQDFILFQSPAHP